VHCIEYSLLSPGVVVFVAVPPGMTLRIWHFQSLHSRDFPFIFITDIKKS
jgi:hypothetical protein